MDPIGTALIAAAVKEAAAPVAALIKRIGLDGYNKLTSHFQSCFQGHVEGTFARCSKMKNILYKDQSVDFRSQYVNIKFSLSNHDIADHAALLRIRRSGRFLVCGTAGAGKTMFMRWAALELIDGISSFGKIPLYLEMRYFDDAFENESLESYLHQKTSSAKDDASFEQFVCGLESGMFTILLDAIDEIKPTLRERVVAKIMHFMARYPDCGVTISSRFDDKLESIQEFSVLRTKPMDRDQIVAVIDKLDYDESVKSRLIERLKEGVYANLDEFLSNPLLATIMLLTFDHSADIPAKLTAFYQQAFEALYQRHDAAKGAYRRYHHAGLPMDRFQAVFSTFSFHTYIAYKFEFSDGELLESFRAACEYNQETSDVDLLILDAMESVCLIQKEGLANVFSHRSFQEYFCALFISRYREADVRTLIEAVAEMETRSNVIKMLYEISPEILEYEWILPRLQDFLEQFEDANLREAVELGRIFSALCTEFRVYPASGRIMGVGRSANIGAPDLRVGKWMLFMDAATSDITQLRSKLYEARLWGDWGQLRQSIPANCRPAENFIRTRRRMAPHRGLNPQEPHPQWTIRVESSDANWLVYTKLPDILDDIRTSVRRYRDDIVQRRNNRRQSVTELLRKPRNR